jgi:thioredoxin-like negative regulator of GroEL
MMSAVLDSPIRAGPQALERILAAGRPALIVFETSECEPCLALVPVLEGLAREYASRVLIARVEAGEGWLAARHHLSFVPTLLFWDHGGEWARIKGNPGVAAVRAHLECLLSGAGPPDPAEGPRHTLASRFGGPPAYAVPRALLRE